MESNFVKVKIREDELKEMLKKHKDLVLLGCRLMISGGKRDEEKEN